MRSLPNILPVLSIPPRTPSDTGLGGLIALVEGEEKPLPLSEVAVTAELVGDTARTVVEQRFDNPYDQPLEAVHIFPLPPDGAVVEIELRAGDVVVAGECREREEAEKAFDEARRQGHRAALLSQERPDVHTLRVTRIPPRESVTVRIVVVARVPVVDGRYRWRFPTVLAPRFIPGAMATGHDGPGTVPDTELVPDASRITPPIRLQGGTTLRFRATVAGPVRSIASSLHALQLDLTDDGVSVTPSGEATLDRDLILSWTTGDADEVAARAWTDGSYTVVVVEPPTEALPDPLPRDAVFVVDTSGSMGGAKIAAARGALQAALHGLMPGDRFKIIEFNSSWSAFSDDFVPLEEASLRAADAWVDQLQSGGGTQMLAPIQSALEGDTPDGRVRTVLFITDGQAGNEAQLTAAVANRRKQARFFTLGIDTAVNASLLERLARVGGGTCELAAPSDDIEDVIGRLEARFGHPLLRDVRVDGRQSARMADEVVFAGRPASLLVEGSEPLVVRATGLQGPVELPVEPVRVEGDLHPLWARERVAALEDRLTLKPFEEEALRPEIVRIALAAGIASRFTSFVAVDRSRVVSGEVKEVVQPVELPHQWEAQAVGGAVPMPRRRMAKRKTKGRPKPASAVRDMASQAVDALRSLSRGPSGAPGGGGFGAADAEGADDDAVDLLHEDVLSFDEAPEPVSASAAPPPAPMERAERAIESEEKAEVADPAHTLARTQQVDGSFGGDVRRTAAALLALILLGHTRRAGSRRRTVLKAARWLEQHRGEPWADRALDALARAERGEAIASDPAWAELHDAGGEGDALRTVSA